MCLAQGPQHSDAGEALTRCPLVSSQALYHWATALPLWTIWKAVYKNICFGCVKETSHWDVSFMHPKGNFDMEKMLIIIFGGYIFLCLPPYYSYFQYFEIKPLVPRTLNFRNLTVVKYNQPVSDGVFVSSLAVELPTTAGYTMRCGASSATLHSRSDILCLT